MAYTFPLTLAQFADTLDIMGGDFKLSDSRRFSYTARGEVIDMAGGSRRWGGTINIAPARNDELSPQVDAMLSLVTTPGGSFLFGDRRRKYPDSDPTGSIISGYTPTITTSNANLRDIAVSGLPASYVLTRGDHLSFSYVDVAGKTQYSLHQIVTATVTANGSGVTSTFEVVPHIPRGVTVVGLAVKFVGAHCKAVLLPGKTEYSRGRAGLVNDGQTFEFVQTKV